MKKSYFHLSSIIFLIFFSCNFSSKQSNEDTATNESEFEEKIVAQEITQEDLVFEPVITKKSIFIKKGASFKEAFYGLSGDSIRISFKSDVPIKSFALSEERSGRTVKTFKNTQALNYEFDVYFDNPFSIAIEFYRESYFNLEVFRKSATVENYKQQYTIVRDSVVLENKTPRCITTKKIGYENVFNEPKKLIISRVISISGKSKVYVPIEIPKNTKEFIYTLRISGRDYSLPEDGKLFDKVKTSSRKINVLGLPLWDSNSSGSSLSREILNGLFPPKKDEDYSLNVFFFDKEREIKKFLNYSGDEHSSAFNYDLNNSALSTQSRVGLIKKPASGYSYLGLQSTSSFSNTYAWLDVVALSEQDLFYEIRYSLKKK